jgi:hypothetical protein
MRPKRDKIRRHTWQPQSRELTATLLNRREFNGFCLALGSLATLSGASVVDAAAVVAGTARTVRFRDGTIVPAIGQGSSHIGQGRYPAAEEEEALRTGLSLGMMLIDTSGITVRAVPRN